MWLLVDVAGILPLTGLHSEEDVGHTHLAGGRGGGEGQGLSCVDTSHFKLLAGVCFAAALQWEEDQSSK